ncbi:MAG TPA: hypothetical protein VGV59_10640 [Pyrinomonadaceae bacterium]|nr:hypothetical protein [Pyrinomonadaceae bacterium]
MSDGKSATAARNGDERAGLNYFNYYTEVEDTFIRRRGKHLLLSPLDWALIESWQTMGVPLHIALRGIERAFDSHDARPRRRSVKSLMYCQEEVEAQYAEWLEGQRGKSHEAGAAAQPDAAAADGDEQTATDADASLPFPRAAIAAHLAEAHAALAEASRSCRTREGEGELSEALARAAARISELEADFARAVRPNAEQLESSLSDLENLLERALRTRLRPDELAEKRALAAEQLEPYRKRMERATYEQTLDNLLAKQLREECGIPRLSLFYL